MMELPLLFSTYRSRFQPHVGTDIFDQLSYYYLAWELTFAALILTGKQFVGAPVECWMPAHFSSYWIAYVKDYCFGEGTYYHPNLLQTLEDDGSAAPLDEGLGKPVNYYQWAPLMLFFFAILNYLPVNVYSKNLPTDFSVLLKHCKKMAASESRDANLYNLNQVVQKIIFMRLGKSWRLTFRNFLLKIVFLVNCAVQFLLVNRLLNGRWGFEWVEQVYNEVLCSQDGGNPLFPRVTMCDVSIRGLGVVNQHSLQCFIGLNVFNSKIFAAYCLSLCIVSFFTIIGIMLIFVAMTSRKRTMSKLCQHLFDNSPNRTLIAKNFFGRDFLLAYSFIEQEAGEDNAEAVLKELFKTLTARKN